GRRTRDRPGAAPGPSPAAGARQSAASEARLAPTASSAAIHATRFMGAGLGSIASPSSARPRTLDLATRVALGDRVALVVRLLALGDPDQQLGVAGGEVELERNDGLTLLRHRLAQHVDLL